MKHLLVPVDFSEYAYNACLHALHLASQNKAKVTLFHVYHIPVIDPTIPGEYLSDLSATAEKNAGSSMEQLVKQLKEYASKNHFGEVEIESHVALGFAVDEIILAVKKFSPGLIVIGRRHIHGMAKILLDSIASAIIEKVQIPVLVVPEETKAEAITNILYASNFDKADQRTLSRLLDFAKPFDVKVHCVHIVDQIESESKENLDELEKIYSPEKIKGKIIFKTLIQRDVADALFDYIDRNNIGLMAMLTHKRKFFAKLFDPSLTKTIAFKTNIPLLVYHEEIISV